jgi:hypothetical protein
MSVRMDVPDSVAKDVSLNCCEMVQGIMSPEALLPCASSAYTMVCDYVLCYSV